MNIILLTDNKFKAQEIMSIFGGFGIRLTVQSERSLTPSQIIKKLGLKSAYIIREVTNLEDLSGNTLDYPAHLQSVIHFSNLYVQHIVGETVVCKRYTSQVQGFIDLSRKATNHEDVYNWDDVFVCLKTMKTYYEMRGDSGKHSARTSVLSSFLKDEAMFPSLVDLQHNPMQQDGVVEFSDKIYSLIRNNPILSNYKQSEILKPLVENVLANGIFTRSAANRRQRNYWFPALNAGLPLVPKSDEIHEVTFMFHDLMHHLIPDLIYDGSNNPLYRDIYVIHRMLGESFTIVLADMLFIQLLDKSGIEYDWSKRKIYPLFKSMDKNEISLSEIKEIFYANAQFALLGNYDYLLKIGGAEEFNNYRQKYEKFFIEDYRWTFNNFDDMQRKHETMRKWFLANEGSIAPERKVGYFAAKVSCEMNYEQKFDVIFDIVWKQIEGLIVGRMDSNDIETSISNAFKNYMIGQSIIFFDYDFLPESKVFYSLISNYLSSKKTFSAMEIKSIRELFSTYLDKLVSDNRLSENMSIMYKEIVPIFEPFYVFYDGDLEYRSVKDFLVANRIIEG